MALKRFSGRENLVLDLGVCIAGSLLYSIFGDSFYYGRSEFIGYFLGGISSIFCTIFIWTWNPQYILKDKLIKRILHTICLFQLSCLSYLAWHNLTNDNLAWFIYLIWGIAVSIKYKRLLLDQPNPNKKSDHAKFKKQK